VKRFADALQRCSVMIYSFRNLLASIYKCSAILSAFSRYEIRIRNERDFKEREEEMIRYHVQLLIGILIVGPPIERTVNVGKSGPVATQIVRHHVNGIGESAIGITIDKSSASKMLAFRIVSMFRHCMDMRD